MPEDFRKVFPLAKLSHNVQFVVYSECFLQSEQMFVAIALYLLQNLDLRLQKLEDELVFASGVDDFDCYFFI